MMAAIARGWRSSRAWPKYQLEIARSAATRPERHSRHSPARDSHANAGIATGFNNDAAHESSRLGRQLGYRARKV